MLPNGVKERLVQELDKRLDLDIDNVIASPKLRLQLSPAELDKRLLELYKFIQTGPRGDVLRIIGGGQEVALQDFYIKTHTRREGSRSTLNQSSSFGPFETLGDESDTGKLTASQWVNLALRKNLPNSSSSNLRSDQKGQQARSAPRPKNQKMEMALSCSSTQTCRYPTITPRIPFTTANHFCPPRKSSSSLSLLI